MDKINIDTFCLTATDKNMMRGNVMGGRTTASHIYQGDIAAPDFALVLLYLLPPFVRNRSMLIPLLVGR
jgi:hypothetical protein